MASPVPAFALSPPLLSARPLPSLTRRPFLPPTASASAPARAPAPQPATNGPSAPPAATSAATKRRVRRLFGQARVQAPAAARKTLRQCLALDASDSHSWLALARLEARGGDAGSARALFRDGVARCPGSVHLLQAWGVFEHRCGERDAARGLFHRALGIEPGNPYVAQAWGLLEQAGGDAERARSLFRVCLGVKVNAEVCAAWGVLEAREGHVGRARELFKKGLGVGGGAGILKAWAEVEERVGDLGKARELLAKAVAEAPGEVEGYVGLARLEVRRGFQERGLEVIRAAASLDATPPAIVFNCWALIEWGACGRVGEARKVLERGVGMHVGDPALLQTLGTLEEECGEREKAKACYARSVEARPTAPAFVAWALLKEKEKDAAEARALFEKALTTDPLHGAAYNAYGMMEARAGNLKRARQVYERGLKYCPSPSVFHGYGQLELKLGRDPDRARELFKCGVSQSREDTAFVWHSWGTLELRLRNATVARKIFSDALQRYPRNSPVLVGAGLAHAASTRGSLIDEKAARAFFKRAVAADPSHAHAWQAWGVFELRQGRREASEALFRRGLRMCPTHGALWQAWGVLEMSNGKVEKARKLFERGSAACPGHVHLLQAWACMETRVKNVDRAREILDLALRSDPSHGPVWTAYGILEAKHGSLAKARQHFVTGINRAPDHTPLYRFYGETEARSGNHARAREIFHEGLKRDPCYAPLYHSFAEFEAMVGNLGALAELKREAEKYFGAEAEAMLSVSDDGKDEEYQDADSLGFGANYAEMDLDGEDRRL